MVRSEIPKTNQEATPTLQDKTRIPNATQYQSSSKIQKPNENITRQKKAYTTALLQKTKDQPKEQAKILKMLIASKGQLRNSPTRINYKNKTHTDPKEIANALNDNRITVGYRTSLTIPQQQEDSITAPATTNNSPQFKIKPIEVEEVEQLLRTLNKYKASDIFGIKPAILKAISEFMAPHLTRLFNQAVMENQYPDSIKITKVIEIYKSGDVTIPKNYRPISLLPIIAKVLDTIINKQLMKHLLKYNLISPLSMPLDPTLPAP